MMSNGLKTKAEAEREQRHKSICNAYLNLANQYPKCKPNRILNALAAQYGMTVQGLKLIVKNNGLYKINH